MYLLSEFSAKMVLGCGFAVGMTTMGRKKATVGVSELCMYARILCNYKREEKRERCPSPAIQPPPVTVSPSSSSSSSLLFLLDFGAAGVVVIVSLPLSAFGPPPSRITYSTCQPFIWTCRYTKRVKTEENTECSSGAGSRWFLAFSSIAG